MLKGSSQKLVSRWQRATDSVARPTDNVVYSACDLSRAFSIVRKVVHDGREGQVTQGSPFPPSRRCDLK